MPKPPTTVCWHHLHKFHLQLRGDVNESDSDWILLNNWSRSGPLWLLCLVRLHASLVTLFALPAELSYAEPAQIEKHTPMRLMLDSFKLVGPILHTTLGIIFYCNTHRPSLSACSCTSQCLAQKWQIGVNTPFFYGNIVKLEHILNCPYNFMLKKWFVRLRIPAVNVFVLLFIAVCSKLIKSLTQWE